MNLRGRWAGLVSGLVSFLVGVSLGILFHYALYRMVLPLEPFIYVAF